MIIVLWWLSGFVPLVISWKIEFGEVTLGDICKQMIFGIMGPASLFFLIGSILSKTNFWDKKIF